MKPIWLLDIDGVVNAASKKGDPSVWPREQWLSTTATCGGKAWPILASTSVLDFLREVHEKQRAQIWWHTTWQAEAQNLADALDLPAWPIRPAPEYDRMPQHAAEAIRDNRPDWWKLPAAERVVKIEGHPLIWTDDDITWSLRRYDVDAEMRDHAPALLVSPNERTGLTPKHLRQISDFLDAHGGS